MKYLLTIGLISLGTISVTAQTKKPAPAKKPVPVKKATPATTGGSAFILKNMADSASYAIGVNIAQSMKKDLGDLNTDVLLNAMKSTFDGKTPIMNEEASEKVMMAYSEKVKENQSAATIKEGKDFLAKNKTATGVKATASGLQYVVLKEGTGEKPAATDTVICNYKGALLNGTEFDNSYDRGEPLTIPVSGVIKGWTEGLQLMSKGSKYKFFIPYDLGYGLRGAPPTIPGGSTLVFEVELLDVKKGK
ncbi:MAG: FKBP-type peptidyl-prolyl cis-trans isomerase [Niabella sp.]|nr:FKBP-type peptidyl-prolyl cis-trans isomerase [Niabella sp.]